MVKIEVILMISTILLAAVLALLLFLGSSKKGVKKQRKVMSKDMRKIKDQISEDSE